MEVRVFAAEVVGLERFTAVHNAVRPDDPTTVDELVDWKRQAEDMVWLLATADVGDAGAGVGLVGWHSEPQTMRGEGWTLAHLRGRGVGSAIYTELERWGAE